MRRLGKVRVFLLLLMSAAALASRVLDFYAGSPSAFARNVSVCMTTGMAVGAALRLYRETRSEDSFEKHLESAAYGAVEGVVNSVLVFLALPVAVPVGLVAAAATVYHRYF
jgi:hypothetical protein